MLTPKELQRELSEMEARLVSALSEVVDIQGISFQDKPWWPEACALRKAMKKREG